MRKPIHTIKLMISQRRTFLSNADKHLKNNNNNLKKKISASLISKPVLIFPLPITINYFTEPVTL